MGTDSRNSDTRDLQAVSIKSRENGMVCKVEDSHRDK